jgi:hypothetical protein
MATTLLYYDCIRVSNLLQQPCNNSGSINKLLQVVDAFSKVVDNLGQAVRTQQVD